MFVLFIFWLRLELRLGLGLGLGVDELLGDDNMIYEPPVNEVKMRYCFTPNLSTDDAFHTSVKKFETFLCMLMDVGMLSAAGVDRGRWREIRVRGSEK